MKKFITIMALAVMLAPTALAGDFNYGQDSKGLYFHSESQNLVYSNDASCLMQTGTANAQCSTQWYVKANSMEMSDAYYNRIRVMKLLGL